MKVSKISPSPGQMTEIEAEEVSIVGSPANKRRFFMIKSEGGSSMTEELIGAINAVQARNEDELVDSLQKQGVSETGIEVAKTMARLATAYADELSGDAVASVAKSIGAIESTDEPAGDEVLKSELGKLSDSVRERIEAQMAKTGELEGKVAELVAKAEQDAANAREAIIKSELGKLEASSLDVDAVAKSLMSLSDENADLLLEALRSADEVAKSGGIFEEEGSSLGSEVSGDAEEALQAAASDLAKSDGIAYSAALQKIVDDPHNEIGKRFRKFRAGQTDN